MKTRRLLAPALLLLGCCLPPSSPAQVNPSSSRRGASQLADEPGTITIEGLLPKPVAVKIPKEVTVYYNADLQRPLGTMAAGTIVTLVALGETAYRVRGRARHGDVAGWLKPADVIHPDPNLHTNLKKVYDRQVQVRDLIANNEVALGMTQDEVRQSLGKPTRTSSKLTAAGRDDTLEYAVFERVPQTVTGRDALGRIVQSIVYVKVETGTLSIHFKNNIVETIEEKKGSPLGNGGVKIVVPPVFVW
jgi:hypothetical protein